MKRLIMVVIALLYSFIGANMVFAAGDTWIQKKNFGGAERVFAIGFSIGSKGYIVTGGSRTIGYQDSWEYDPVGDIWTQKADFVGTVPRGYATGFSIGSKGYIGTGTVLFLKDFYEYDSVTNKWTQKADFRGTGRIGAVGFSIGSKGYIGTGWAYNGAKYVFTKDFWEYDPATDKWTQKADFGGLERYSAAGFSIGNKGYIGMGNNIYSNQYYNDFWEYDPATDTWTRKADGKERMRPVSFSIGNKGYVGMGFSNETDFWEYDPAAGPNDINGIPIGTWTQKTDFGGIGRDGAVGFSIGNKGYAGTGCGNGSNIYYKDFWAYEPADTVPDQFIFNYETGVDLNTVITSNTITVSGINAAAPITITGGTYSINGGDYTDEIGEVNNGDTITVQQTSSEDYLTTTIATLTIGGVSDIFSVTTRGDSIISLNPVANITTIWPPNNKMVPITIQANASDSAGGPVTLTATVSCNEPAKRRFDWTDPVINQQTGVISLSLRASRLGRGTGRIYTITITATGTGGNLATKAVTITVPHDQRR